MNNLYFLVEGRRTEMIVYPKWLAHLLPHYSRVERFDDAVVNNYFLFSGTGYPALLRSLEQAVANINSAGRYSHLVVCLDAEEDTPENRIAAIEAEMLRNKWNLGSCRLVIIVQNRCIETWFLGNRKIVSRNPQSATLAAYLRHHDVRTDDPELMPCHPDFDLHADFHEAYLKELFAERNLAYTKRRPGHVCDKAYLEELLRRVLDCPGQLQSLQTFLNFCDRIYTVTAPAAP